MVRFETYFIIEILKFLEIPLEKDSQPSQKVQILRFLNLLNITNDIIIVNLHQNEHLTFSQRYY